jgi:soluble lytic murein transglycosylase-like protein
VSPTPELLLLSREAARKYGLDEALVCAVIEQESAWQTHSIRFEPTFQSRYVKPLNLAPTEEVARSISWGLMQVMGQVARECGFKGDSLAQLCDPSIGLDIGCKVLHAKLAKGAGDFSDGLEAWNGGRNLDYAREVMQRIAKYQKSPPTAKGVT